MNFRTLLRAGVIGVAVACSVPALAGAEILTIMNGAASGSLSVSTNRAVVVESQEPFAELSIANPGIADISTLSDRTIYVLGKAPGRTTLTLLGPDGRLITNVDVQVSPDTAEYKERLEQIIPGENIEVRTANDGIVLSGTVSSIARMNRAMDLAERYSPGRVSNLMVVGGTQQVMLKVRFAEVSRNVSKSFGVNLGLGESGTNNVGVTGSFVNADSYNAFGPLGNSTTPVPDAVPIGSNLSALLTGQIDFGSISGLILLEALESKGLARTLSEPNLVALSGQQARFLAGGEVPFVTRDQDGSKVEFKPFGVELQFTPRVIDGDKINLEISTAVSAIDETLNVTTNGGVDFGFSRRETSTTVEMHDGESFAVAGLLQDDFGDAISQVPWLGDLPVLGTLFRSTQYQRAQSELVIIVTPHLVTPTVGEALTLPTDRVSIPLESSLFLNGNLAGSGGGGAVSEVAKQDFTGSYGYVME